ncbi:hypothetical protein LCGC14_0665240 [marine sediment metagenome]|uniref:Uncharacterized protein n=1 Tax=marine sediment metagenome TaxID=412755 RepID=A0A0F9U0J8_9ZZZZ
MLGVVDASDLITDGVAVDSPSIRREASVDVPPHTLAHMQAQGRASATTAEEPEVVYLDTNAGRGDLASLDRGNSTDVAHQPTQQDVGPTADVATLICAYSWPQGCAYWTGIARCESTLGQDSSAYADWNPYVGLLQIWVGHGYGREWLKVDTNNVLAAWELSHEGTRTSPWPYCQ